MTDTTPAHPAMPTIHLAQYGAALFPGLGMLLAYGVYRAVGGKGGKEHLYAALNFQLTLLLLAALGLVLWTLGGLGLAHGHLELRWMALNALGMTTVGVAGLAGLVAPLCGFLAARQGRVIRYPALRLLRARRAA